MQNSYKISVLSPEMTEPRTKILEFLNSTDEWEQEILFAEDGFYSLSGKDALDKYDEYLFELDDFANKKINELQIKDERSREFLLYVKKKKIDFIKSDMEKFVQDEMRRYAAETNKKTIELTINRAILHKTNPEFVEMSKQNGLSAVHLLYAGEGKKALEAAEKQYKSDFVSALINAFLAENDLKAYYYFEKFKDEIDDENREKLEKSVNLSRVNIIGYNFAKELFSYNLPKEKRDKEIRQIKDDEIEKTVKTYLSDFEREKKRLDEEETKSKNETNTEEIVSVLASGEDNAYLYIDYSLGDDSIKFKKEYIKRIKKDGEITTNAEKFAELLYLFIDNFDEFKKKDISEYILNLSSEDFSKFKKLQELKASEYAILKSDYCYMFRLLNFKKDENPEVFRSVILLYSSFLEEYEKANKKAADITARNKIISEITTRYTKQG